MFSHKYSRNYKKNMGVPPFPGKLFKIKIY